MEHLGRQRRAGGAYVVEQGDDIARELQAMSSQSDVEAELAALKAGGGQGAIGGGNGAAAQLESEPHKEEGQA